jgi:hypothetical protein
MLKRSPEEIWRRLVEEAGEDEIERAASVSVAQAEKDLAAAGFDVAAEREKADALLRKLEQGSRVSGEVAVSKVVRQGAAPEEPTERSAWVTGARAAPPKPLDRRWVALIAAAVPLVVLGGGVSLAIGLLSKDEDQPIQIVLDAAPSAAPSAASSASGRLIRERALKACDQKRWRECIDGLSSARELDPGGDADSHVQAVWRAALDEMRKLDSKEMPPPRP